MTLKKFATVSLIAVLVLATLGPLLSLSTTPLLSTEATGYTYSAPFSGIPTPTPEASSGSNPSGGGSGGG